MQLTTSFLVLLDSFVFVFTTPSLELFSQILTGWTLSQRHRFVTEIIFSSGNVKNGHWSRFHRFFSHAAWDIDFLSLHLARLVVAVLCPGALLLWAVDDTLCRKRGLSLFGAGMHHDPLISSKAKPLVSWGHDWVVLSLLIVGPCWAPSKVFALPITARLYKNRQGLTKGKKTKDKKAQGQKAKTKPDPNHRSRPQLAVELIGLVAKWLPQREHLILGDSAYGGKSVLSHLPDNVHLISYVHPKGALYKPAPPRQPGDKGAPRKKGERLPTMQQWADDATKPWTNHKFDQFGLHTTLAVKTQTALYYKAGGQRLLNIVLTRDRVGQRPDHMFYCTKLDWKPRDILSAYACRWATDISHAHSTSSARWVVPTRTSYSVSDGVAGLGSLVPTTPGQRLWRNPMHDRQPLDAPPRARSNRPTPRRHCGQRCRQPTKNNCGNSWPNCWPGRC